MGKSELETVYSGDHTNHVASLEVLGDSIEVVSRFAGLYERLTRLIERSKGSTRDEILAGSVFLFAIRYELTMAILTVTRCHLSDSFFFTRRAIELCAFAARVKKHPHLAGIWLEARQGEKSYANYRDKFSPGKLFPEDHVVLGKLYERYDVCSMMSHPSSYSFAGRLKIKTEPDALDIKFEYFEGEDGYPTHMVRAFLWNLDTHVGIVLVLEEVFREAVEADRDAWLGARNEAVAALAASKSKWKGLVAPDLP